MNTIWLIAFLLFAEHEGLAAQIPTVQADDLPKLFSQQLPGSLHEVFVQLFDEGSVINFALPAFLLKGAHSGRTLAITAGIHGDEVTGVRVVQNLMNSINAKQITGNIVAFPVLNPFGFARYQRGGVSGKDINRCFMAEKPIGEEMFYAEKLFSMMAAFGINYHVDLHTATFGNNNSFYIRADLQSQEIRDMARILEPQIILNTTLPEKSLRGAMASIGVFSVTMEMGGPMKVNDQLEQKGVNSLLQLIHYLNMTKDLLSKNNVVPDALICSTSEWVCANRSGLICRRAEIMSNVTEGDVVAEICDAFGNSVANITTPISGVVIGNTDRLPVTFGARIVHIGKLVA